MEKIKNQQAPEIDTQIEPPKKKSGFKWILIAVIFIGLGVGIYLGRGDIAKVVKDIPVLNSIFKSEKVMEENTVEDQVNPEVEALKVTIAQLNEQLENAQLQNDELKNRIKTLEQYETQYGDFVKQKQQWETEVASQNPKEFVKYYEQINPEQAQNIYKDLKEQQIATAEQKQYAKIVAEMEEEQAAKAIEKIVGTSPELVKYLFAGMASERQSAILSVMDEQITPQVIKLIAPEGTR